MNPNLYVLFWLLFLHQTSSTTSPIVTYGCRPGKWKECKNAKFVPGHTLLGEGINIVSMKTTGSFLIDLQKVAKNCTVCNNPHVKNVLQKLPKALVDWRPETSCTRQISSSVHQSKVSVANAATSTVQNDWKVGLSVRVQVVNAKAAVGGSHSNMAKFADSKSLTDNYNFLSHKLECAYYSFRLSSDTPLTPHFAQALRQLPTSYDDHTKAKYRRLISTFGTHYIMQAKVGGRTQEITAVRTCQVTTDGMTVDEVKDCLNVEAEIAASTVDKSASFDSKFEHCKKLSKKAKHGSNFHQTFNERIWEVKGGNAKFDLLSATNKSTEVFQNWMESLKTDPGLVSYSLDPIHNLVSFKGPQKENLRLALSEYIKEMALIMKCSCSGRSSPSQGEDCSCVCPSTKYTNSDCCPTHRATAKLHLRLIQSSNLWGDTLSKTDAYVKFNFDTAKTKTPTIWNNNNPRWNSTYDLGIVEVSSTKKYTIEVWDENTVYSDSLLGKCSKTLTSGDTSDICYLKHGSITYSLSVICSTYLQGLYCQDYSPVPPVS